MRNIISGNGNAGVVLYGTNVAGAISFQGN